MSELIAKSSFKKTTSNLVASEFGIAHRDILNKIMMLKGDISEDSFNKMYKKEVFKTRGREFSRYSISRDGYMMLLMSIPSSVTFEKKEAIIKVFNQMEAFASKEKSFMDRVNEAISLMDSDSEKASACASGLSRWKRIKKQRESEVKKLINQAQLILKLEPGS